MYFPVGVNEVLFTVTILDEKLVESAEEFYIDLEISSSAANRGVIKDDNSPSTVTVTIFDDDGECSSSALCTTVNTTEHSECPYCGLSDHSYCAVSICLLD